MLEWRIAMRCLRRLRDRSVVTHNSASQHVRIRNAWSGTVLELCLHRGRRVVERIADQSRCLERDAEVRRTRGDAIGLLGTGRVTAREWGRGNVLGGRVVRRL